MTANMKDCRITDCFFDLYGTLVDIHTDESKAGIWDAVRSEILSLNEGCLLSAEEMSDFFWREQDRMRQQHKDEPEQGIFPEMNMYGLFRTLLVRCGVRPTDDRVSRAARVFRLASTEHCRLYSGAMQFLINLKESGRRIWLVTNAQRVFTMPEIERLGLDRIFDGIYISSDIGFRKPDSRMFLAPIKEHGLDEHSIVMIGNDGTADIAGAKACGLKTVYFRTNCSPQNDSAQADICFEGADYESLGTVLFDSLSHWGRFSLTH